jgi:PKD repeat protein
LYTAAEIIAAGGQAGNIVSLAMNCTQSPAYSLPNYTISMKSVPSTMTTLVWQPTATGFTQVYNNANYMPSTGWQNIVFGTPFDWNGTDNIVVYLCWDYASGISSTGGTHEYTTVANRMLYSWTDATGSSCGEVGTSISSNLPNINFVIESGCMSNRVPVQAVVYEKPEIDLGADINDCVDVGHLEFLNARNPGFNYEWDNNYNGQVRVIDTSGTYWVIVDNGFGCANSDTINVNFKYNPVSALGNDTIVCHNTAMTLDAGGNGIQYIWSTGGATQSININKGGLYTVAITGANGCVTMDSIVVTEQGNAPKNAGIWVRNVNANTFNFSLINPQSVSSLQWDFGDGSPLSYLNNPTHTYATKGNYVVRLLMHSTCGSVVDTTTVHILGLGTDDLDINNIVRVYPNPTADFVTVEVATNSTLIEKIHIIDAVGRVIDVVNNIDAYSVKLNTEKLNSGMYHLHIETSKGLFRKKLDVIK